MLWTTSEKHVAAVVSLVFTVLPFMIRTHSFWLSDSYCVCFFCLQTVRNAVEPWTLCLWLTAQSQWVWLTSPWRRILLLTPSTDWDPLQKTPSQKQVDAHFLTHMFPDFLSEFRTRWLQTLCRNSCLCFQAQEWESFSTVTVEPSRPSDSTTPRSIHCLLSRSHTQTRAHMFTDSKVYF